MENKRIAIFRHAALGLVECFILSSTYSDDEYVTVKLVDRADVLAVKVARLAPLA